MASGSTGGRCVVCNKFSIKPKKCSRCKVVFYCNRKCQILHWKGGHRKDCKEAKTFNLSSDSGVSAGLFASEKPVGGIESLNEFLNNDVNMLKYEKFKEEKESCSGKKSKPSKSFKKHQKKAVKTYSEYNTHVAENVANDFANRGKNEFAQMYKKLGKSGTNNKMNEKDLTGDGDQSDITDLRKQQFHRELFAAGGDLINLVRNGEIPFFPFSCIMGDLKAVKELIEQFEDVPLEKDDIEEKVTLVKIVAHGKLFPSKDINLNDKANKQNYLKEILLETRYGILRQPPLFLTLWGWSARRVLPQFDHKGKSLEVFQLLLKHGARYNAHGLTGKTIVHMGTGPLCLINGVSEDETVLKMVSLCLEKDPKLVNAGDRFHEVPLMIAVMLSRKNIVKFLCEKWGANPFCKDFHNNSPHSLAVLNPHVLKILKTAANRKSHSEFSQKCHNCKKIAKKGIKLLRCSRCKAAVYCNATCQKQHWKEHKKVCNKKKNESILFTPTLDAKEMNSKKNMDLRAKLSTIKGKFWTGGSVEGINIGDSFNLKIQWRQVDASEPLAFLGDTTMVAYNKSRSILSEIRASNCNKYKKLLELVQSFKPCFGKKAYFKATLLNEKTISLDTNMFTKQW